MTSDRAQILITAIDQTRPAFASVKSSLAGMLAAVRSVSGVLASLGAAVSAGAVIAFGRAALNTADDLSKLSQKTGLSVESLSLLRPIAEQSGVSLEGLAKGLQKLATSMVAAAQGGAAQAGVFSRLGVAVTTAAGQLRPTEDVLLDLAEAFAAMPDGAEKSALAVKLFGKSGVELIPFLNQGRAGIEQLKTQFAALGLEISGSTATAAERFNDTLDTVKQALQGIALRIAEAALPALQAFADGLVRLASHGDAIVTSLRVLGEVLVTVFAVRGLAAIQSMIAGVGALRLAMNRLLPILIATAAIEFGSRIADSVTLFREVAHELDELAARRERIQQLDAALDELGRTGTLSIDQQLLLASAAAERLQISLPQAADALRSVQGAATQLGEAIKQAIDAEVKQAGETIKALGGSFKQVAADAKATVDARLAAIEAGAQQQLSVIARTAQSEDAAIRGTTRTVVSAELSKLDAVKAGAAQMESTWQTTYGQAIALAQAASQDVTAIERQSVGARIGLYSQLESAYRATVNRLTAEEQRHLEAARSAEEARLSLRLSVEDRIRELSRKGLDELAAYQDRQRQIDEKQAAAQAALRAGNFEQARKLAEDAIALSERSAQAVTKQVEDNGKTVTQTIISDAKAANTAIEQVRESASIADAALQGLGESHKIAAAEATIGALSAKNALAQVGSQIDQLRQQLASQDKLKLEVDLSAAQDGIRRLKSLADAEQLSVQLKIDTAQANNLIAQLQGALDDQELLARVTVQTTGVLDSITAIQTTLEAQSIELPALASFEQPRRELAAFLADARLALTTPTASQHNISANTDAVRRAIEDLKRPTSSVHTVFVQKVQRNALGGLIQRLAAGGQAMAQGFRRVAGRVFGPGTETSDSVPALLSAGEFVIRAATVRQFGTAFFESLNAGFAPVLPQFAGGGLVAAATAGVDFDHKAVARDVVDLRFHIGGATHTVQSSRDTANALVRALRDLSRAG